MGVVVEVFRANPSMPMIQHALHDIVTVVDGIQMPGTTHALAIAAVDDLVFTSQFATRRTAARLRALPAESDAAI